jgi:hypothetical protein
LRRERGEGAQSQIRVRFETGEGSEERRGEEKVEEKK